MINIAISGFGRIGRVAFRASVDYADQVKIAAINTSGSMDIEGWIHLLRYDSVYGRFKKEISFEKSEEEDEIGKLVLDDQKIPVLAVREPKDIPWKKYQVQVVLDTTGAFRDRSFLKGHLDAGAKKVIVSATSKDTETIVMGVNQEKYKGGLIISNASCTTNCVAAVSKIIKDEFGIQKSFMSTIHAYTSNQNLVDASHKDLRRARSAPVNIIPTSTGAAEATAKVIPSLSGIFEGSAYRVPIVGGSLMELIVLTTKRVSVKEVNQAFKNASEKSYRGIVGVTDEFLVSTDILGRPESAIVDLGLTQVIDQDLVKIVAWYDNEWGYSCRLIEEAIFIGA